MNQKSRKNTFAIMAVIAAFVASAMLGGCSLIPKKGTQNQTTPSSVNPVTTLKNDDKTRTVVASNGISRKVALPQITAANSQFRPVVSIGKEAISGTGTADNDKLDKLGDCVPNSIFVEPEIFVGLSEMQSIALREAIADACKKANADFLVAPRYELSVSSNKKDTTIVCTVVGYPARITDFVNIAEESPEVKALKAKVESLSSDVKNRDERIARLSMQIDELKSMKTREDTMTACLELMKKYEITDMNGVRRTLALMGEIAPVSERETIPVPATEANVLEVKPGNITLNGNVGVQVPVEVPAIKVKIEK